MKTITPAQVAFNRTARLVRENTTPVYTTETKVREHITAVEMEDVWGRNWATMPDSEVTDYIDFWVERGKEISDIDHAAKCWCFK